ncbi:MAG: hypothetical protein EBV84_11585, partial [Betaproteobacteria bacterium]|nr:hypothetical protein [Betaproteobacteria bacterium]
MRIPFVSSLSTRLLPLLMGIGVSVPLMALLMLAAGVHPLESATNHAAIPGERHRHKAYDQGIEGVMPQHMLKKMPQ